MIRRDREIPRGSGSSETDGAVKKRTWQRVTGEDRPPQGSQKPGGGGSRKPNGPSEVLSRLRRCRSEALTRPRRLAVRGAFGAGERKAASRGKLLPERKSGRAPEHRSAAGKN